MRSLSDIFMSLCVISLVFNTSNENLLLAGLIFHCSLVHLFLSSTCYFSTHTSRKIEFFFYPEKQKLNNIIKGKKGKAK